MRYLTAGMIAILLAGCAGPAKGSPAYFMEKQRQVLYAQCLSEYLPRSYAESQFVDEFAVTDACGKWARKQVFNARDGYRNE